MDVSQNAYLDILLCYRNQLTNLNLSQNQSLSILNCHDNQLEGLDLSQNPKLAKLICYHNPFTDMKVFPTEFIEIAVDEGVNISGNEKTYVMIASFPVIRSLRPILPPEP